MKNIYYFEIDNNLKEILTELYQRGYRHFKYNEFSLNKLIDHYTLNGYPVLKVDIKLKIITGCGTGWHNNFLKDVKELDNLSFRKPPKKEYVHGM